MTKRLNRQQPVDLLHPATQDLYHWLLSISWEKFLIIVVLFYFTLNSVFTAAYFLTGNGIANSKGFADIFFFSIQTISTVGYGAMYPQTLTAQIIMAVEVLFGLLLLAILTGLMFARFAKPTARVIFSRVAVICPFDGIPTLMLRAANQRKNQILEAQIQVSVLRNEITVEGHKLRRFYDLNLTRSRTPVFGLSWLIMHPIDEASPLYGVGLESLQERDGEIWVTLTGLDETFSQTIHARYSYSFADIICNHRFVDIFSKSSDGRSFIDLRHFHDVIPQGEATTDKLKL
jgi:inward rectifier potassium channel